jgi:hypothetical protein
LALGGSSDRRQIRDNDPDCTCGSCGDQHCGADQGGGWEGIVATAFAIEVLALVDHFDFRLHSDVRIVKGAGSFLRARTFEITLAEHALGEHFGAAGPYIRVKAYRR